VPVEIVSGITAGVAAAAAVGVPLTHRDCTLGAIFVTGHAAEGHAIDWAALVASRMTLVIYMGVARAAEIERGLLDAGLADATPVAIVERASQSDERTTLTRAGELASTIAREHVRSPAILVVGEVVRYAMRSSASAISSHSASSRASDQASSPCRASEALSRSFASSA
jgi:uroporphyrin-III C-methyltransferase